jgi:hypothetical protein
MCSKQSNHRCDLIGHYLSSHFGGFWSCYLHSKVAAGENGSETAKKTNLESGKKWSFFLSLFK